MYPEQLSTGVLYAGQVGYLKLGMKNTKEARVGDTICHAGKESEVTAFPGFQVNDVRFYCSNKCKPAKPMVFAGLYPESNDDLDKLRDAIEKLTLNDASVAVEKEHK